MAPRADGTGGLQELLPRMTSERVRRRVVVHGDVQGVFFRDSTRERAEAERVAGWIRNRGDGAVEAVLEGEPAAVERVIEFCRSGPSRADVNEVEVSEEEPEDLADFQVR